MTAPAPEQLKQACEALAERDAALARAYDEIGVPAWRTGPCSFEALAKMLAYQQVSTKAGAAIWSRVEALVDTMTANSVLALEDDLLRGAGLSRAKVRYIKAIATSECEGSLCFERVLNGPREDAHKELVAVTGIGPWSAQVFLLTATGCLDAWPPGDVGLMESYRQLSEAEERHTSKAFCTLAEAWAPWRGVATHLLWGWLNEMRDRNAAPVE
ncbi:MAG: DNA-3-methyladenine glycosylase 2 family protein [Hyphomonadaceae bacterium]|nr:DNA-3-methyladenine glycosylase 2 family protein [Hyphomonadaceae bacterium]